MARSRHTCPDCGEAAIPLKGEPEWVECRRCGEEFEILYLEDLERLSERYADVDEFADDDDDDGTWESYGRHRTRLRDSDD